MYSLAFCENIKSIFILHEVNLYATTFLPALLPLVLRDRSCSILGILANDLTLCGLGIFFVIVLTKNSIVATGL
jgi:hypothetical protein